LYVAIGGGEPVMVSTFSTPQGDDGFHRGTTVYQGLVDTQPHEYRFFTVGVDGNGNVEAMPDAPLDVTVTETFDPPAALAVTGFDVQQGAAQRSYVRYLDVSFNRPEDLAAIIASMTDGNAATDRLRLTRYDLNGQNPTSVSLSGVSLQAVDRVLTLDFGIQGLGGNRNGLDGNGYYQLSVDTDGNVSNGHEVDKYFYRLAGDTNGDRRVDSLDLLAVNALLASGGYDKDADVNGDGVINTLDRLLVMRGRNRILASHLWLDD
jgi:hypothetical protein